MFQTLNGKGNRYWTKGAGLLVVSLWVAVLIAIPLIYNADLPAAAARYLMVAPPLRPLSAPAPIAGGGRISVVPAQFNPNSALVEPIRIPDRIIMGVEDPAPPGIFVADLRAVPGGMPGPVPMYGVPAVAPPPSQPSPPKPEPEAKQETPASPILVEVGGDVQSAKLIFQPRTPYPALARQARVQGTVRLEAIINMDGTIEGLRVLSGHPLLVQAALDSVIQWRYQPTLLNGQPVEVMTVIEIHFTLGR